MAYTDKQYERTKELLLKHRGSDDPITSREISDELDLDDIGSFPNTRECIRDIMFEELIPVVGANNGYYVAESADEIDDALETLQSRITNTAERRAMLERAARKSDEFEFPED